MTVSPSNIQPDDLAALYQNMTLDHRPPMPAPTAVQSQPPAEEPKIVYISQHYTHSAHVAPPARHVRAASEPPQPDHSAAQSLLKSNGVDPSDLSSAQLSLFTRVEDSEKLYLIDMWRTYPPTRNDNLTFGWSMTSMSLEESLAMERAQRQQQQQQGSPVMSLDGTPLTPVQTGFEVNMEVYSDSEPYMIAGFEEMVSKEVPLSFGAASAASTVTYNPQHSDLSYNRGFQGCSRAYAQWG